MKYGKAMDRLLDAMARGETHAVVNGKRYVLAWQRDRIEAAWAMAGGS